MELKAILEGLLFATEIPLSVDRMVRVTGATEKEIKDALKDLIEDYALDDRGLRILESSKGFRLCTRPEIASFVERLLQPQASGISAAALEALAIIAYRQPVTRAEIDYIRGVRTDSVLSSLLERGLIREAGRKEAPGRPILFETTDKFLMAFGLNSIYDLPPLEKLENKEK